MKPIKKILLPTDFEAPFQVVFEESLNLAKQYGAELHILHVNIFPIGIPFASTYFDPEDADIKSSVDEYAKNKFDEIKKLNTNHYPIVTAIRMSERVNNGIIHYIEENNIDFIVMSTHGRRAFAHFFLGSIAEEVLRLIHIPMLLIKEKPMRLFKSEKSSIIVPIDFSSFSKIALKNALDLVKSSKSKLHLIHVLPNAIQLHIEGAEVNIIKNYPDLISETTQALKNEIMKIDPDFTDAEFKVLFGVAPVEISDYADKNHANMIMMSSHGLTGLKKLVIGSVTEKLARIAKVPVLVLKE